MEDNIQAVSGLIDTVVGFAVQYGFQILGALVVLIIGLKVSSFAGRKVTALCQTKDIDVTLSRFIGNVVKIVLVVMVVIVTLGNFGISIAPFIALAGASAFGATLAIQGPLSNYGAGLSIILARPFVVGNTINVQGVSGVVHEITLAQTVLIGEDGEKISIPNKEVVGQVIVNSREKRVVQTKIQIGADQDVQKVVGLIKDALAKVPDLEGDPAPLVGIHDFAYGGVVVGVRFWVLSDKYFATRYTVNSVIFETLEKAGVALRTPDGTALSLQSLSADDDKPGYQEPIA